MPHLLKLEDIHSLMEDIKLDSKVNNFKERQINLFDYYFEDERDLSNEYLNIDSIPEVVVKGFSIVDFKPENIVGIDTSSFKLGDTDLGYIAVLRGSIVSIGKSNKIIRLGPYVIHITYDNALDIINTLRLKLGLESISINQLPSFNKILDRVRNYFERFLQLYSVAVYRRSIILFDGSLMGGTVDTPVKLMNSICRYADSSESILIGISKSSTLRYTDGRPITSLLPSFIVGYIDVYNGISRSVRNKVFGRVYVARFSAEGDSLRVDVYPGVYHNYEYCLNAFYHNASFVRGYPNILLLAHKHSVFRKLDVIATKAYITKYAGSIYGGGSREYILPRY